MKRWGIRIDTNTIMFATSRAYSLPKPAPHRDMTKAHDDSPFAVMNSCFGDCGSKLQVMLADMQMSLSGWTTGSIRYCVGPEIASRITGMKAGFVK